jgi:hypothetical protein
MEQFKAILVEGLFYEQTGSLHVEKDGGEHTAWDDIVADVLDRRVQIALHHLPPHGIQPGQPGAGSCRYPGGVGCPVGHDRHPNRLLSFHTDGVLRKDPWRVVKFDGSVMPLPLMGMVGHFGRVGVATVVDLEKMREQLSKLDPEKMAEVVAAAGVDASELEAMLDRLMESRK